MLPIFLCVIHTPLLHHASITLSAKRKKSRVNQKTPDTQITINSSSRAIPAASIPHTIVYIFDTKRKSVGPVIMWNPASSRHWLSSGFIHTCTLHQNPSSYHPHPSLCLEERTGGSWWNSSECYTLPWNSVHSME